MIINMNGAKAPEPSPVLQEKTVTPETLPVVIGTDEGYDGLSQVTVNPDADLKSENIKEGKSIFGVDGSYGDNVYSLRIQGDADGAVSGTSGNGKAILSWIPDFSESDVVSFTPYTGKFNDSDIRVDKTKVTSKRPLYMKPEYMPYDVTWFGITGTAPIHKKETQTLDPPTSFPLTIRTYSEQIWITDRNNGSEHSINSFFPVTYDKTIVPAPDNLTAENIKAGVTIAGVEGTYDPQPPEPVLESVVSIPSSFPVTIRPSEGYDGIRSVTVNSPDYLTAENIKAGVTIAGIEGTYNNTTPLEEKTIKATAFPTVIEPQSGYALSRATVTAPDNLSAENIKKDVSIAGITGTYAPKLNEDDRVVTSLPMTILPNPGSYGISKVILRKPVDLKPENIRAGATIIGVTGTYDNSTPTEEGTVKPTSFPQEVVPTEGHAFSKVTVEAPDNLSAENIRKDVTIAGVTGTYSGTGGWNEFLYSTGTTTEPLILSEETIRIGADHKCLVRTAMDPYAVGQTTSSTCSPLIRGVYQLAFTGPVDYSDNGGLFAGCTLMGGSLGNMSALTNVSFPRNMFRFTYLRGRVYLEAGPSGTLTLDSYCFTNMKGENRDKSIIDLSTANSLHVAANQTIQYATIVLPANVTFASDYTFNVSAYGRIRMTGRTPPTLPGAYLTIASDGQIMVPKGCLSAYRSATNWSKYASFMVEASE